MKIDDIITKLNLRQSAFCIEIFDADIQIPETSLQALSPFFPLSRPHPRESLLAGLPSFCSNSASEFCFVMLLASDYAVGTFFVTPLTSKYVLQSFEFKCERVLAKNQINHKVFSICFLFSFKFFLHLLCISLVPLICPYSAQILLENALLCRQNARLKNRLLCSKFGCRRNLSKPVWIFLVI